MALDDTFAPKPMPAVPGPPPQTPPPAPPPAAPPPPRKRIGLRILGALLATVLLVVVAVLITAWWALRTERGSAWLLSMLPGVQITSPQGAIAGDFKAAKLVAALPGGRDSVTLTDFGWRGLGLQRGSGSLWASISLDALYAKRVDVVLAPAPAHAKKSAPLQAPANLKLPVEFELRSLKIGEVHATPLGDKVVRDIDAALHLGADAGAEHRIDHLNLVFDQIKLAAKARVASSAPMALNATLDASQDAVDNLPAWTAKAVIDGPLAEPVLQADLRASPKPDQPEQRLDARATLRPFAPWPLGDLTASAKALDLSAFVASAPVTSLNLEARATSSAADQPVDVVVDLQNDRAGRWSDARVPLYNLKLELSARPDRATDLDIRALTADLGTPASKAGQITATGRWSPEAWQVDALLADLQPSKLDARAPVMTLSGPVNAVGKATPASAPALAASAGASAPGASASAVAATAPPASAMAIDLKTDLTGRLVDGPATRPVSLRLDASLDPDRIDLRTLAAAAGAAKLSASGTATHDSADAPWVVKAEALLARFDPGLWVPGGDASPWRKAKNELNAKVVVESRVPLPAAGASALDTIALVRGKIDMTVARSLLAGVPLGGEVHLHSLANDRAQANANFDVGGNTVRLDGQLATTAKGASDTFDLAVDAKALAALTPIFKLVQPPKADTTLAGTLTAKAHLAGRWPDVTTHGNLDVAGLRIGTLGLQQAQARWTAGTSPTDPVDLDATLSAFAVASDGKPGPSIETATVKLSGTARAHTLDLRAVSKALPPAWAEAVSELGKAKTKTTPPPPPGSSAAGAAEASASAAGNGIGKSITGQRTVATLRAKGGLVDQPGAASSGWRGTLQSLEVRSNDLRAKPLVRAEGVSLEAFWAGGPVRAEVQPGRVELLGGGVHWTRLAYEAAATSAAAPTGKAASKQTRQAATPSGPAQPPRIEIDAEIEPLSIAPILAQMQPDFGWGGDLVVGGKVMVRSRPTVRADILIDRRKGDLTVTDEVGRRKLGLSDLHAALKAENGTWNIDLGLAGTTLGTTSAKVTVQTTPDAIVPGADATLGGTASVSIDDLGTLGSWAPVGWRVDGALNGNAKFSGRVGAPAYTGEITASKLALRNFLLGVKVTDGDLAIKLDGTTATIERFTAKGGDGTLNIAGNASFGEKPQARIEITADKFKALSRIDRTIVSSGTGTLNIDAKNIAFKGKFGVDQGLIDISGSDAPSLGDDVTVVRAAGVPSPAAAASAAASPKTTVVADVTPATTTTAPAAPQRNVDLDLRFDLGNKLEIKGHGLAARLAGELLITAPQNKLAINGTISVVDGTYEAYGQNLVIDHGLITFNGPVDQPVLDIEATRPKLQDVRVGVKITGFATNPRVRLFSDPAMSETDELSWLILGKASDQVGNTETALLQRAALALVSGEGPGVTDRVTKALGLDELSLGGGGTGSGVQSTVLTVGKKLSDKWSVGYQRGLNAATGSFQLIYQLAKRLTVRAQSGQDNSVDLIWKWRWN